MRNNNSVMIRRLTGVAILIALVVVLGLISNYIPSGTVNINLALIPIVIGACLYGPLAGLLLGVCDGVVILLAPTTSSFLAFSIPLTIVLCLVKTGVAGLVSGFIYKLLRTKNSILAVILASLVVPVINTGIFLIGVFAFFVPYYEAAYQALGGAASGYSSVTTFILLTTLTINFLIEFITNAVLSPTIHQLIKILTKNKNIGCIYDSEPQA